MMINYDELQNPASSQGRINKLRAYMNMYGTSGAKLGRRNEWNGKPLVDNPYIDAIDNQKAMTWAEGQLKNEEALPQPQANANWNDINAISQSNNRENERLTDRGTRLQRESNDYATRDYNPYGNRDAQWQQDDRTAGLQRDQQADTTSNYLLNRNLNNQNQARQDMVAQNQQNDAYASYYRLKNDSNQVIDRQRAEEDRQLRNKLLQQKADRQSQPMPDYYGGDSTIESPKYVQPRNFLNRMLNDEPQNYPNNRTPFVRG